MKVNVFDSGEIRIIPFEESETWVELTPKQEELLGKGLLGYRNRQLVDLTEEHELEMLRLQREEECFHYINRGKLWYDRLTNAQLEELNAWYNAWLDVTITKVIPQKPSWLE